MHTRLVQGANCFCRLESTAGKRCSHRSCLHKWWEACLIDHPLAYRLFHTRPSQASLGTRLQPHILLHCDEAGVDHEFPRLHAARPGFFDLAAQPNVFSIMVGSSPAKTSVKDPADFSTANCHAHQCASFSLHSRTHPLINELLVRVPRLKSHEQTHDNEAQPNAYTSGSNRFR
jgi:hypothetical protein